MTSQEIAQRTPQQELVAAIRSDESRTQIAAALEGSGIPPSKFVRVALTAINENAQLVGADRSSLFGALMRCAQDGLLPDGREAALVMFGQKATYMAMVAGLRKIAAEHGWAIIATIVHENDSFDPDLETHRAHHKPVRLGMDPGDPIGAYAVAEHRDGRRFLEVMNLQEIEAVRATSRAKNSGPWVDFWGEMARKTVVRRLFKSLPLDPKDRERIDRVLAATGEDGIVELYGEDVSTAEPHRPDTRAPLEGTPPPSRPEPDQQAAASGPASGAAAPGPDEVPFEGEEPAVVIPAGKHQGKTLDEVYALGEDGIAYLRLGYQKAKTQPLRAALDEFAETHPEIKS
jgi:recombination protein RecT